MTQPITPTNSKRIDVVDALRGFTIVAILLLHNIEHFDLYYIPEQLPEWMKSMDTKVWSTIFLLFGGKAYSIFAILFGFTFCLQYTKQAGKGNDFAGRFAWRLLLLFGFGLINTAFYVGDILLIYSIIGLVLIPVRKLNNKWLIFITAFLLLQPIEWIRLLLVYNNVPLTPMHELYGPYFQSMYETMKDSSFFTVAIGNFEGKSGHILWYWSAGRVTQTAGFFTLGLLLGRAKRFSNNQSNTSFWIKILILSLFFFTLFNTISYGSIEPIIELWSNLAFTCILISGFILLYHTVFRKILSFFIPLGRMSLTSYIMQSVIGSFIYYGYGLALYQYTGASLCVLIGVIVCAFQWLFCKYWLKRYRQGPLEKLWHKLTWI